MFGFHGIGLPVASAAPASFSPIILQNLLGWWDSAALSALSQDANGATPVAANGNPIGRWMDIGGAGTHATQANGSAKPTYATNAQNGLPAPSFDGGDYLDTAATVNQNSITIFAVIKTGTLAGTFRGIFSAAHNVNGGISLLSHSSNKLAVFSGGNYLQDANVLASDTAYCVACTHDGVTRNLYRDGVLVGTQAQALGSVTNIMRIGALYVNSTSLMWNGYIPEVAIYSRALGSAELTQLFNYGRAKYNTA